MKTLKVCAAVAIILSFSVPSFGYILIYNTFGSIRAVDSIANTLSGVALRGYLILDINNADGEVNNIEWICYGKGAGGTKVYTESVPYAELQVSGKYQTLYVDVDAGWDITFLGRMSSKDIGMTDKKTIAYTMSGSLAILDSTVLDATQLLRGGGTLVISLNSSKTQTANTGAEIFDDVITDIETTLESAGYH